MSLAVAISVPLGIMIEAIKVPDRRGAIKAADRNHRIWVDLRDYDRDGFRAGKTRPDRAASAMDDAQLRCCHGIPGGSLRRSNPVAGAINGRARQLPPES